MFKQTESTLLQLESLSKHCFSDFQPVAELFFRFVFFYHPVQLLKLFCITRSMWWDPEAISSWKHYQQAAMLSIMTIPFKGFWSVFKCFLNGSPSFERQITSSNMDFRELEAFFLNVLLCKSVPKGPRRLSKKVARTEKREEKIKPFPVPPLWVFALNVGLNLSR